MSALYLSEDAITARKEFGDEGMSGSTAVTYTVTTINSDDLRIIEMDAVLTGLSSAIPNIASMVGVPAMHGTWVDNKFPASSQILGHWLRHHAPEGTHGIRFKAVESNSYNVCLFFHDGRESKAKLVVVK